MPLFFVCPNGHRWEVDPSPNKTLTPDQEACPICRTPAVSFLPDLDSHRAIDTVNYQPAFKEPFEDDASWPGAEESARSGLNDMLPADGQSPIPGYEIIATIARGGMAVVYKARHVKLKRLVALKVIRTGHFRAPDEMQRFLTEAQAVASLDHPNIVPIYEVGEAEGLQYYSMKLIEGGTLASRGSEFANDPQAVAALLATVADGVHFAHERGVLHRDLKPSNILLDVQGHPHITDFGVAIRLELASEDSEGTIVGTPRYMAPEQASGRVHESGPATDVYALGVILYELLTGQPVFGELLLSEVINATLSQEPVPPTRINPHLPRDLESICLKCLQKDPQQRYPTALELADDLRRFLSGDPITARAASAYQRFLAWIKRRLRAAGETVGAGPARAALRSRISELERAAEELQQQSSVFHAAVEAMPVGVLITDASGKCQTCNPTAGRILGLAPGQLPWGDEADFYQCYDTDGKRLCPREEWPLARAIRGERSEDVEILIQPAKADVGPGTWVNLSAQPLVDEKGMRTGGVVVLRDITQRRLAEQKVRDSEALYHSLVESLVFNVYRKDLSGKFTFANQAFCDTVGKPIDQILGKRDSDLFLPELAEKYRSHEQRMTETCESLEELEVHNLPDGEKEYTQVLMAPVHDASGRVVGTQGVSWNVTRFRRVERELQQTVEDLRRSNAELEQFAYVASHDLQEPLRMVASYTQLLRKRYHGKLDADADEFIAFAVDGATRMQGLINDLLAYSRVGTRGQPLAPTDSTAAFDTAIANLKASIEESGAQVTRDQEFPSVRGDTIQLVQVFQNLIGNAIKFRKARSPRIHVGVRLTDEWWRFSIKDDGIGIEARHLDRIFVIFQRLHTREEHPGSGIGLAMCKKIVERHGGRIWARSRPGVGSIFYFTLPVLRSRPTEPGRQDPPEEESL